MKFTVSEGRLLVKLPGPSAFKASGLVSHSSFLQLTPDIERLSRGLEEIPNGSQSDPFYINSHSTIQYLSLRYYYERKLGCLLTVQICLFEVYWEVHKGGVTRKSGAPNPNATKAAMQRAVHAAHFIM